MQRLFLPGVFPLGYSFAIAPSLRDGRLVGQPKKLQDAAQLFLRRCHDAFVACEVEIRMGVGLYLANHPVVVQPDEEVHVQIRAHPGHLGEAQCHVPAVAIQHQYLGIRKKLPNAGQVAGVLGRLFAEVHDILPLQSLDVLPGHRFVKGAAVRRGRDLGGRFGQVDSQVGVEAFQVSKLCSAAVWPRKEKKNLVSGGMTMPECLFNACCTIVVPDRGQPTMKNLSISDSPADDVRAVLFNGKGRSGPTGRPRCGTRRTRIGWRVIRCDQPHRPAPNVIFPPRMGPSEAGWFLLLRSSFGGFGDGLIRRPITFGTNRWLPSYHLRPMHARGHFGGLWPGTLANSGPTPNTRDSSLVVYGKPSVVHRPQAEPFVRPPLSTAHVTRIKIMPTPAGTRPSQGVRTGDAVKGKGAATHPEKVVSGDRPAQVELWCVAILCLLAAGRIFFGAAALPFFADTDEDAHFDLIHKFARGYWPDKLVCFNDEETVKALIYDSSPEFLTEKQEGGGPAYPPPVRDRLSQPETKEETKDFVIKYSPYFRRRPNHEAHSPPVYYALAAVWYDLGRLFSFSRASEVYWVRFLNVPLYAALVALAYAFCRPYFGRDTAVGVAALTAFFPNTVFFSLSNDVLSPLVVLLTLLLLLRWYEKERPGAWLAIGAGAMAAIAVLTKLTNGSATAAVGAVVLLRFLRDRQPKRLLSEAWPLLLSAALPLFLWGLRNRLVLGDWSGSAGRMLVRQLKPKPLGELLHHPVFTATGLGAFLQTLCTSLFRGDMNWAGHSIGFEPSEGFFKVTSVLLPMLGLGAAIFFGARAARWPTGRVHVCLCRRRLDWRAHRAIASFPVRRG